MPLSDKEIFDAEIIKEHFSVKEYTEGENPPDIYLNYESKKVGIELTELSSNLYKNRISVDKAYEGFIKNIDIEIPDYTRYLVVFHHANIPLNKALKKEITAFLKKPNNEMKKCIKNIFVKIKSIPSKRQEGTISQMSSNINSCSRDISEVSASLIDSNIENVFGSIINKAIETKIEKCKNLNKPIWLALHDSYFSYIFSESTDECIDLYKKAMNNIDFGMFEKIIIIFKEKEIMVFNKGAVLDN